MPYTWMRFSTASPPEISGQRPMAIRNYVEQVVRGEGGHLLDVYFDVGQPVGYALMKDLGDSAAHIRVSRAIGGLGATKMLDAAQAEQHLP